ncbi:hypothetical protein JCGZ_14977 [Jatropha curcas]|uniref:Uncharacterized protein n=1 Tax=Jatropha curcas TaxID=180498 RepID=A0A067KHM9_JATCU|nr:hypothetical protein JCGZ_14977 [Jatropha curcas]
MRKSGKKQQCIPQGVWEAWQEAWRHPDFVRKCEIYSQNRLSETSGPGAGLLGHTGGSISTAEVTERLMGCEPTPIEVFKYTHTKDHDLETIVDRHTASINPEDAEQVTVDGLSLYWKVVGGEKKKVYNWLTEHVMQMSSPLASRDPRASSHSPAPSVIVPTHDSAATHPDTSRDPSDPPSIDPPADTVFPDTDTLATQRHRFDCGPFYTYSIIYMIVYDFFYVTEPYTIIRQIMAVCV